MVCVGDFKMSGPKEVVEAMWQKFNELGEDDSLQLGPPQPLDHFLACQQDVVEMEVDDDGNANIAPMAPSPRNTSKEQRRK